MSTTETFILGKDKSLEASIQYFQQQLQKLNINIKKVSWLNPVPNVWSVHIHDLDCPACFANGKGASKEAALASALGEFFERLSTNYYFADYYLGNVIANADFVHYPSERWFPIEDESIPVGILDKKLLKFYDPNQELVAEQLVDLQSGNYQRGIVALPYTRVRDQKTIYFPQSIVANLYVSNGMAAGNTREEAYVQALSEIFERYVKNKIISQAISLPEIPLAVLQQYPKILTAINSIESANFKIYPFDASLGGQYPVICVALLNPSNNGCYLAFGAHPKFEVALERTVTELLQGRSLKNLNDFPTPSFALEEVAEHTNLETHFIDSSGLVAWDLFKQKSDYVFTHWDLPGNTQAEYQYLLEVLHQQKKDVYIMDYQHLGVNTCRILVPSISEIYPIDDLVYANNNAGMFLRDIILSINKFDLSISDYQDMFTYLEDEGFDDFSLIPELIGILPDVDTAFTYFRIGELKCMLALATKQLELALEWANWTLEVNDSLFIDSHKCYYRCLISSLELYLDKTRDPQEYYAVYTAIFSQDLVDTIWAIIKGANPFYQLPADDLSLKTFSQHQQLLAAYNKIQQFKSI